MPFYYTGVWGEGDACKCEQVEPPPEGMRAVHPVNHMIVGGTNGILQVHAPMNVAFDGFPIADALWISDNNIQLDHALYACGLSDVFGSHNPMLHLMKLGPVCTGLRWYYTAEFAIHDECIPILANCLMVHKYTDSLIPSLVSHGSRHEIDDVPLQWYLTSSVRLLFIVSEECIMMIYVDKDSEIGTDQAYNGSYNVTKRQNTKRNNHLIEKIKSMYGKILENKAHHIRVVFRSCNLGVAETVHPTLIDIARLFIDISPHALHTLQNEQYGEPATDHIYFEASV